MKISKIIGALLLHTTLIAGATIALVPFIWMVATSFKLPSDILSTAPTWLPREPTFRNYELLFSYIPFLRQFINTLFVTIVIVLGQLLFSSMGAYAFARLRFPGRDGLFLVFLATLMVPNVVTLIPAFIVVRNLGWVNTYMALIGPAVLGSAFATFLLRQFMLTIPAELEEAAKIDGAGHFTIYWRIILPLVRPALAVVGIFAFVAFWNDFLWPLVVINSESLKVLTVGIAGLASGPYGTDWGVLMAGSTLTVMPLIVVFLALQRHVIEGVAISGLK
ncbi:carbohydrate ABC transporter permease [Devosia algicola]|uniref:Carbohydrate ABC transporter permease n=1 Tax=Devosia algicola TaxID=3026418 RepID=A0ABY7YLA6_9HYPH|nr:carbohydrate ABC transporter permease [Devosia algicola]WDR01984.1 carbohydrate ABC transporter permease [Devosia algicola]